MQVFPDAIRQQMSSAALKPIGWTLNLVARISGHLAGEWALRIFSRPRSAKSHYHHPEILNTSRQIRYYIDQYDLEVNVFHWPGCGPTVFLAHGWESNSSRWLPLINALRASNFRVVSLDAPAHGLSGGREFNVVMYTAVLKEIFKIYPPDIFIGHSAGGMAGVYHLFLEKNATFQDIILMAVPHELEDLMDTFRRIVGMNDQVFAGLKASFETHFGFPMSAFSVKNFVREIPVPGLVVHDKADTIAPYAGGMAIHENWTGSTLVTTDGLGHSLPGQEVVKAVVGYLQLRR